MRSYLGFLLDLEEDKKLLNDVAGKFAHIMEDIVSPILVILGAAAAVYAIYLGVMYAKAEDTNKRKEVQGRLIGAAVGLVIILVGIAVCFAVNWAELGEAWAKKGAEVKTCFSFRL